MLADKLKRNEEVKILNRKAKKICLDIQKRYVIDKITDRVLDYFYIEYLGKKYEKVSIAEKSFSDCLDKSLKNVSKLRFNLINGASKKEIFADEFLKIKPIGYLRNIYNGKYCVDEFYPLYTDAEIAKEKSGKLKRG